MASVAKRALIVVAVFVCLAVAGAALYFHRAHRASELLIGASSTFVPDLVDQLPVDAPGLAYIDVASLRKLPSSPLAAALGLANGNPEEDRDYQDFVRGTGFDYTRDLDRVALAFWPASYLASTNDPNANPTIAVADGRFDQQRIEAYALRTGRMTMHGAQSVYEVPGSPAVAFEFLSSTRIALASGKDAAQLVAAVRSAPRDSALEARIIRVAAAPIFAIARTDNLPASFYANFRGTPQLAQIAHDIQSLTLVGKPAGDAVFVLLEGECTSTTNALEISTSLEGLRMLGSLALMDPKSRGQMTREQAAFLTTALREIKVTRESRFVRLSLNVTPAMLSPGIARGAQGGN